MPDKSIQEKTFGEPTFEKLIFGRQTFKGAALLEPYLTEQNSVMPTSRVLISGMPAL
jgi:hypothetical protein